MASETITRLQEYFGKAACIRATSPLKKGTEINLNVDGVDLKLVKSSSRVDVIEGRSETPDMSLSTSSKTIAAITDAYSDDIGDIGVSILKNMGGDAADRITVKLHIGLWDFLRGGYLGILPLGGPSVMKHLASKGLTGIGKIKEAISRLREEK